MRVGVHRYVSPHPRRLMGLPQAVNCDLVGVPIPPGDWRLPRPVSSPMLRLGRGGSRYPCQARCHDCQGFLPSQLGYAPTHMTASQQSSVEPFLSLLGCLPCLLSLTIG